jgi:LAO/AO transport system kinase
LEFGIDTLNFVRMWQQLLQEVIGGNVKSLARGISIIENEVPGYEEVLEQLPPNDMSKIIGITGSPGSGKSTLTDALTGKLVNDGKRIAILCIDPSSPFNKGALLGDRIRMSEWYNHPDVFIRSLATRGSLGGLSPKIIEITDLLKAARFDYILIETVGVGQSEIEISGLADTTVVVLVPGSGDEVQIMKAGIMEIADIFVVNKSDYGDADTFVKNLRNMLAPVYSKSVNEIPIIKTIASEKEGIQKLKDKILEHLTSETLEKKYWLLAEKAYQIIQNNKMKGVKKNMLKQKIMNTKLADFNLYRFIKTL